MRKALAIAISTTAIVGVAAAGATATPPEGAGPPESAGKPESPGSSAKCKKPHGVAFVVGGTLTGYSELDLTLEVSQANRHARRWLESNEPTFSTEGAVVSFVGVTDADASGAVGFEDVAATDRVRVIGKLVKPKPGCEDDEAVVPDQGVVPRKIKVSREAPEAPSV
jgi:hypothetical protein